MTEDHENPCIAAADIYHMSGLLNQFLTYMVQHVRDTGHNAADRECGLAISQAREAVISATSFVHSDVHLVEIFRNSIKTIKADVLPFIRMPEDHGQAKLINHLVMKIHDTDTSEPNKL